MTTHIAVFCPASRPTSRFSPANDFSVLPNVLLHFVRGNRSSRRAFTASGDGSMGSIQFTSRRTVKRPQRFFSSRIAVNPQGTLPSGTLGVGTT